MPTTRFSLRHTLDDTVRKRWFAFAGHLTGPPSLVSPYPSDPDTRWTSGARLQDPCVRSGMSAARFLNPGARYLIPIHTMTRYSLNISKLG